MAVHARNHRTGVAERIKAHWQEFKEGKPGHRFQERYHRRQQQGHSLAAKFLYIGLGLVLFIVGLVMLPAPGPGFLVVVPGAALIAEESYVAARTFDAAEVMARRIGGWAARTWKHAPLVLKAALIAIGVVLLAAAAMVAYEVFFA